MPKAPICRSPSTTSGGNLPFAVDLVAVHLLAQERLEPLQERLGLGHVGGVGLGEGVDQVEAEVALEQLPDEARRLPLLLARGLGDVAGFLLGRCLRREVGVGSAA